MNLFAQARPLSALISAHYIRLVNLQYLKRFRRSRPLTAGIWELWIKQAIASKLTLTLAHELLVLATAKITLKVKPQRLMQRAGRFLNNLSPLSQKPKNNLIGKPAENARYLWSFLNRIFNKVDENRIKECGPDRAASEWLIRCGASVRWKGYDKFHNDYNTLPSGQTVIEAIDATDSCIMSLGFPYLRGLKSLQEINLSKCYYLEDNCLHLLGLYQGDQIRRLRLVSCGNVSDAGIANLTAMKALEELFMFDLPAVKNREACIKLLHEALPKCKIEFPEV